jgi:hypothetical protein
LAVEVEPLVDVEAVADGAAAVVDGAMVEAAVDSEDPCAMLLRARAGIVAGRTGIELERDLRALARAMGEPRIQRQGRRAMHAVLVAMAAPDGLSVAERCRAAGATVSSYERWRAKLRVLALVCDMHTLVEDDAAVPVLGMVASTELAASATASPHAALRRLRDVPRTDALQRENPLTYEVFGEMSAALAARMLAVSARWGVAGSMVVAAAVAVVAGCVGWWSLRRRGAPTPACRRRRRRRGERKKRGWLAVAPPVVDVAAVEVVAVAQAGVNTRAALRARGGGDRAPPSDDGEAEHERALYSVLSPGYGSVRRCRRGGSQPLAAKGAAFGAEWACAAWPRCRAGGRACPARLTGRAGAGDGRRLLVDSVPRQHGARVGRGAAPG